MVGTFLLLPNQILPSPLVCTVNQLANHIAAQQQRNVN